MALRATWTYNFTSPRRLEQIFAAWTSAGPWEWALRDSAWDGDDLNTRPLPGVRVRIHEPPGGGYSDLLQIETGSAAAQNDIDRVFRDLMTLVEARDVAPAEPYD
jgi:hypothetical protein